MFAASPARNGAAVAVAALGETGVFDAPGRYFGELGRPRPSPRIFRRRPRPHGVQEDLEVVDRGDEGAAQRRFPAEGAILQHTADTLERRGDFGEWTELGHRRGAAQGARGPLERGAVRPRRAGAEQETVQLLDVFARFQDEEFEKTRRCGHPFSE